MTRLITLLVAVIVCVLLKLLPVEAALCVPLFFLANCTCCTTPCSRCDNSGSHTPGTFQVVLGGISNNSCAAANCSNFNTTWVVAQTAGCTWWLDGPSTCGFTSRVRLDIADPFIAGQVTIDITTQVGANVVNWWELTPHSYDCGGWSSLSIPWLTDNSPECKSDHSAAVLTSL